MQTQLFCFLASYSVAYVLELARLLKSTQWLRTASLGFTVAGLVAQIWYLLARSAISQLPPLMASTHDWLLVSTLILVGLYVTYSVSDWKNDRLSALGLFVLPVGLMLVGVASLLQSSSARLLETERIWTMVHTSSLSLGITGVLIGFLLSLMYLVQHRRLKAKQTFKRGFALPPLVALARYNRWAILISVPLLTLGLFAGVQLSLVAAHQQANFTWTDPVILGFLVLWVGMVGLFAWLWRTSADRGRQVAQLTAWACGFLIVTILGLQLLVSLTGIPSQHGRHAPERFPAAASGWTTATISTIPMRTAVASQPVRGGKAP